MPLYGITSLPEQGQSEAEQWVKSVCSVLPMIWPSSTEAKKSAELGSFKTMLCRTPGQEKDAWFWRKQSILGGNLHTAPQKLCNISVWLTTVFLLFHAWAILGNYRHEALNTSWYLRTNSRLSIAVVERPNTSEKDTKTPKNTLWEVSQQKSSPGHHLLKMFINICHIIAGTSL